MQKSHKICISAQDFYADSHEIPKIVGFSGVYTISRTASNACSTLRILRRSRGKGNPMDAFGHEVAPRTQHLMIDGPYKINRNPMLTGTLIYLAGAAVWLWTWQSCVVFVAFFAIMMVQVLSEEKRLRRDFGEEYEEYCKRSRRF